MTTFTLPSAVKIHNALASLCHWARILMILVPQKLFIYYCLLLLSDHMWRYVFILIYVIVTYNPYHTQACSIRLHHIASITLSQNTLWLRGSQIIRTEAASSWAGWNTDPHITANSNTHNSTDLSVKRGMGYSDRFTVWLHINQMSYFNTSNMLETTHPTICLPTDWHELPNSHAWYKMFRCKRAL